MAAITAALFLFLFIFLIWPLGEMVARSLIGKNGLTGALYYEAITQPRFGKAFYNSMCMVVLSTITATFVGYVFAYAVARVNLPGKSVFRAIIILQLISLPFSSGLAFLLLFGRNGLITSTLLRVTVDLYGLPGLWFVQTLSFFPVAYLVLAGVLRTIDPTLEYAARNLGAGGRNVFVDVILPLSIPGVANAMLLVALNVLADFGNPILIGGNFSVLATEIYLQVAGVVSNFGMAGVFSIFLLVPVVSIFLIQKYLVSKRLYVTVTGAPTTLRISPSSRYVKWGLFTFCAIISILVVLIYASIIVGAFTRTWGWDYSFSLNNMQQIMFQGIPTLINALTYAAEASIVSAFLGVLIAYLVVRRQAVGRGILDLVSTLPSAIPGVVLGVGYIFAFNTPPLAITGTAAIIVLNHIIRRLPTGSQAGSAGLRQIDVSIEEASMSLGASRLGTIRRIVFPLLKSAFGAGFIYTFIKSMTTVSAAIFLVSADTNLPSVIILGLADNGYPGQAAALSLVLFAGIIGTLVVARLIGGSKLRLFEV
jgi:iron(III) transport system permease protein